ncbi:outer membrane family protein [Helicobacter baculiformis]|uniref:Outer membrane family protein n=1 Tax=Helicobacter baculiformis TaxID=427351 RepID=A0ABV7ZFI1_9HELI|nr:outer membrane family protein [Helicobacter baculiformis]
MKPKSPLVLLLSLSHLCAFDYKIGGRIGSFSRIGFNNSQINSDKGIYPTGSYVTAVGALQIDANLLPESMGAHKLSAGLGGELGGLAFDSTRTLIDQSDPNAGFQPASWYYMGRWQGYLMDAPWHKSRYGNNVNTRNYVLYSAYISYSYKNIVGFNVGRYRSRALFLSGYNQGFECFVRKGAWRLEWFSSYGRGRANLQYIRDFYAPVQYRYPDGRRINYGMHAINLFWSRKSWDIQAFLWFYPKDFSAPEGQISYDTKQNLGTWRIQNHFYLWFPIYSHALASTYWRGNLIGRFTASFLFQQNFLISNYHFGWSLYKNFGNANARIARFGTPINYDTKDNTPYEGRLDNLYNSNAITIVARGGGTYKKFSWEVLGRLTYSPRANEESLGLTCFYNITKSIRAMLRVNYYEVSMHRGYKVGYFGAPNLDFAPTTQDRSYVMTSISYKM